VKIAFCVTCKNRLEHLKQTLPKNLADNASCSDVVFVVLDYNSQDDLLEYLKTFKREIDSGRLVVYSFREPGPFRMAHAKNMSHRLGFQCHDADVLVNLDADNYTTAGFADYIREQFSLCAPDSMFLWSRMIKDGPDRLPRGISGRIAVTKHAFLKAGGYDERFNTWSPDDKDFNLRLRCLGYTPVEIENRFLDAVLHNDKLRFREYPHAADTNDFSEVNTKNERTIANFGRCGVGMVYRNFNPNDLVYLSPLPTRIFGIGMHKTATTSLNSALKTIGLDSAHWLSAHWARRIWEEMMQDGRSLTLEKSYALIDLPLALLYRQIDFAYPGSKFILTKRHPEKWIKSVENHWDETKNPFRSAWDTDPFSHRVHKLLYGQKNFDRELFMKRYHRHNNEVLQYFSQRPTDLLVMEMDDGAGWSDLCSFLKVKTPNTEYPRVFATKGE
jgi:glycosyltransferase involved in cell wall biosynthesis